MTKEDIEIRACLYEDGCHNPSIQDHFADGAEWARKQMLEQACRVCCECCSCHKDLCDGAEEQCRHYVYFRKMMED